MTAINILSQPDAVHLFGDGASYNREGTVVAIGHKSYAMPSLSAACLFSGRSIAAPLIFHLLERNVESFDDLQDGIEDRLPGINRSVTDLLGDDDGEAAVRLGAVGQGFELFFAGWSHRSQACRAFAVSSAPRNGLPAYTVRESGAGFMTPAISAEHWVEGFGCTPDEGGRPDNLENFALTVLELQRQHDSGPDGRCTIGGLVELVEVRRDRVDCRILKRWPEDRVGELIEPRPVDWHRWRQEHPAYSPARTAARAPEAPITASVVPMTRQQRRAAERASR